MVRQSWEPASEFAIKRQSMSIDRLREWVAGFDVLITAGFEPDELKQLCKISQICRGWSSFLEQIGLVQQLWFEISEPLKERKSQDCWKDVEVMVGVDFRLKELKQLRKIVQASGGWMRFRQRIDLVRRTKFKISELQEICKAAKFKGGFTTIAHQVEIAWETQPKRKDIWAEDLAAAWSH